MIKLWQLFIYIITCIHPFHLWAIGQTMTKFFEPIWKICWLFIRSLSTHPKIIINILCKLGYYSTSINNLLLQSIKNCCLCYNFFIYKKLIYIYIICAILHFESHRFCTNCVFFTIFEQNILKFCDIENLWCC
jgi:hypothetical protein